MLLRGANNQSMKKEAIWLRIIRIILTIVIVFFCYRLIIGSAAHGLSRLYTTIAIIQPNIEPVDKAVRLTPNDPEAHYTRGLTLVNLQRLDEAVKELREAIRLRPFHYY